jgi:3D (Asp-Asp-Asp) domain-containing protein
VALTASTAPSPGVAPASRSRWVSVELSAYSISEEEGTASGITFTGVRARSGTVATDPAVIPLGSRLRITGLPGEYRAEDTGGAIRGARIDVFMESRALAFQFGRRSNVWVEVLEP